MKDTIRLRITADGGIDCVYDDDLVALLGAQASRVCRASNVEWEVGSSTSGWVVRSAKDSRLAIRLDRGTAQLVVSKREEDPPFYFTKRESALAEEVKMFWQLFEPIRLEQEWVKKGWETNPCPMHGITGCMWCRYGEGPCEPPRSTS